MPPWRAIRRTSRSGVPSRRRNGRCGSWSRNTRPWALMGLTSSGLRHLAGGPSCSAALRVRSPPLPPRHWLGAALERLPHLGGGEAGLDGGGVVGGELEAEEAAVQLLGHGQGRAAAAEGVEDRIAGVRAGADDPAEELLGHLAA